MWKPERGGLPLAERAFGCPFRLQDGAHIAATAAGTGYATREETR